MERRTTTWLVVAALFTIVNFASAIYAAVVKEPMHSGLHVALTLLGMWWVRRIVVGNPTSERSGAAPDQDRIEQLQQSGDAVALEVDRIGEAQRFSEKLRAEKIQTK